MRNRHDTPNNISHLGPQALGVIAVKPIASLYIYRAVSYLREPTSSQVQYIKKRVHLSDFVDWKRKQRNLFMKTLIQLEVISNVPTLAIIRSPKMMKQRRDFLDTYWENFLSQEAMNCIRCS